MTAERNEQGNDLIFALDIGTRSITGMVGKVEEDKFKVLAIETEIHEKRAMRDGQIEDIHQVAKVARMVTDRLEVRCGTKLRRVCVAAAGRALRTERAHIEWNLPGVTPIGTELVGQLEARAVSEAEAVLARDGEENRRFFLVGYTVVEYQLDHYPLTTLKGHKGQNLEVEVVATFLPSEVVESLYAAMQAAELEVVSLTLEPIAALNAVIPKELRLLNLVLVDIGAGTSDIAVCREGSVVGYSMATLAGDEVTEALMRALVVDFETAEQIKLAMDREKPLAFVDVLGMEQQISQEEVRRIIEEPARKMAKEIAERILEVNGGQPSALFMAGGGSKLAGLRDIMAECLQMDLRRVALAGHNFEKSAVSDVYELNNAEYATPLGIGISAGLGLINDSYFVTLNGQPAKLFRSGALTVQDVLLMNGYTYPDMIGRTGKNLSVMLNGRRMLFRGEPAAPCSMRLNGQETAATAVVNAGDSIDFVPARHGKSAERTLGELLGPDFAGSAMVNGAELPLSTMLCTGDDILAAQREGKKVEEVEEEPLPDTAELAETAVLPRETESGQQGGSTHILFNDEPMTLAPKQDGTPYYLMDLLRYSGIDFERLDQPVLLQVNGQDAFFRQVIRDRDSVSIRCQNRTGK